jgi:hypothetical protein
VHGEGEVYEKGDMHGEGDLHEKRELNGKGKLLPVGKTLPNKIDKLVTFISC